MLILSINWTNALIVTLLGFLIVFIVLCLLVALLSAFGVIAKNIANKTERSKNFIAQKEEYNSDKPSEKESAAIAMALHLFYADVHDEESYVITIKNSEQKCSSWNSKIYNTNNLVK